MITTDWASRRVPVFAGQHDTHIDTGEEYVTRSLGELFSMEPGREQKRNGLAIIPSTYADHDARTHAVQREHGSFIALTGDVDTGDHPLERIVGLVRLFVGDAAWLIYSSPHSRPGERRWRIMMPLHAPMAAKHWIDAQEAFYGFMEARGIAMDHALARVGQPVYLPNVPARHVSTGEALRDRKGQPLYFERAISGAAAPGLRLDHAPLAYGLVTIQARRDADEQARQRMKAEAERKRAGRQSGDRGSLIDAFNRSTTIADLLAVYAYEQSPRHPGDWRSPYQQGQTFATRIMGSKWVSLSASDVSARVGAPCASGCFGDGYDLYVHFEHGGDHRAALRHLYRERADQGSTTGLAAAVCGARA